MECRLLTWNERELWSGALAAIPPGRRDIYYTPSYCRTAAGTLPPEQLCAWLFRDGGETALYPFMMRPLAPLGLLPEADGAYDLEGVYGYNGVISSCDETGFRAAFYEHFTSFCRERRVAAEFTRFNPLLDNAEFSSGYLDVRYLHDTVIVDLRPDGETRWTQSYDSRNRNMIRKARRHGVTCRRGDDWEAFRRLYLLTMDNCSAAAAYYFDAAYFDRLRRFSAGEGQCLLLEAVCDGRVVAALLLMLYDRLAHYHLSARDPAYSGLAAGNLLLDYAGETAREAGAEWFHLGGGRSADDSLMRFKAGFSPQRGRFAIGCRAHDPRLLADLNAAWAERHPDRAAEGNGKFIRYRD